MSLARFSCLIINCVGLCVCVSGLMAATTRSADVREASVLQVNYGETPEMKELAERARQTGNELYPKVLGLLGNNSPKAPHQFEIVFKKRLEFQDMGPIGAYTSGTTISLSADWLTVNPTNANGYEHNPTNLDLFLIHEMAHLAQQYRPSAPRYWEEGIAEYVRYKLGYTNGWSCPQCALRYPHYTSGYWCAGAFLLYLDAAHDSNIVRQLNRELCRGTYSDRFFVKATGLSLEGLWAEFEKIPAFTPIATDLNNYHQALGFVNGKAPPDYEARFKAYVQRPEVTVSVEAGKFAESLANDGKLPGCKKIEPGQMLFAMPQAATVEAFPLSRTIHGQKNGDPSVYHYTVSRASENSGWKLQRAWQTDPGGRVIAEYTTQSDR